MEKSLIGYIQDHFRLFINNSGGWDNLIDYYKHVISYEDEGPAELGWLAALVPAAIGVVGAVAFLRRQQEGKAHLRTLLRSKSYLPSMAMKMVPHVLNKTMPDGTMHATPSNAFKKQFCTPFNIWFIHCPCIDSLRSTCHDKRKNL